MNQYQDIIGRIHYCLGLAVVALLPFPQIFLRYACVLWVVSWFLEGRWLKRSNLKSQIANSKLWIPFVLFGLWYAWKAISFFWSPDHAAWAWQMERYLAFGLMIPMGLWGLNEHYRWQTLGKVLIASCVIALPAYMAFMTALFYHPEWVPYFNLPEPWIQHEEWWTFFAENISHFKHRLFLCSVELFGAIIAFRLYYKRPAVLLPLWAVMLSSIPLTGSRQAILSAVALFFVGIICSLPAVRRRRYGAALVLLGVVLGAGLLHLHPRMQEFELSDIKEMRELSYYHDIRLNIWGAALQHPEEYLAHGLGAGQSSNYLREKYRAAGFDHYVYMGYHPHNQYLEELMEIGLPGLLLFLLAWLSVPICAQKEGRLTAILFTTLFMLNMCTDCMFGRFCGIALWAVGLVFLLLQTDSQGDEQPARDA